MASNKLGARKNAKFKAVSTAPSFNKTPVGNSTPPLPYPVTQDLGSSAGVVPTVKFNSDPAYVLNQSTQSSCKGDAPGSAKGVKSGTVSGEVKPVKGSSTVRVGGKPIIRQGDPCTLNGGNCPGIYVTSPAPGSAPPPSAAQTSSPPAKAETPEEKSFLEKAAQDYKDKLSPALHEFAGEAMDTGGTITAAGGATAGVGGVMVATGIGAAPGAVAVVGGGATAAVGGGVSGVGAIVEGAATGLDALATLVTGGQLNVLALATAAAQRMVMSKIDKLIKIIPGKKKPAAMKKDAPPPPKPGAAGDGVGIAGSGKTQEGRCNLKPYGELKCAKGQDAHHVLPDRAFRPGKRGTGAFEGGVKEKDGLAICLESNKEGKEAEHTLAHDYYDKAEKELAANPDSPVGLTLLGKAEDLAAESVEKATKGQCRKENLKEQLREHHQKKFKLKNDVLVRAKKGNLPKGEQELLGTKPARRGRGR